MSNVSFGGTFGFYTSDAKIAAKVFNEMPEEARKNTTYYPDKPEKIDQVAFKTDKYDKQFAKNFKKAGIDPYDVSYISNKPDSEMSTALDLFPLRKLLPW